jgi:NADPH2:quinone reductase
MPEGNEVLIEQEAVPLNFEDALFRNGSYPLNGFPATIGGSRRHSKSY